MATHSSVIACRTSGMEEPGRLLSMESHRVRHDWSDLAVESWKSYFKNIKTWNFMKNAMMITIINIHNVPSTFLRYLHMSTSFS